MTAPAPFHAIIVAGGQGLRAGLSSPKQYAEIGGRTLINWCASAFAAHPQCARIILVVPPGDDARAATATSVPVKVVAGGATRQQSVAAGLAAVDDADPADAV